MTRRKPKLGNTPSGNYEGLKQNCSSKSSRPEAFQLGWSQNNHCTDWRNKSSVIEYQCLWNFIYWSIWNVCGQIVALKWITYRGYCYEWSLEQSKLEVVLNPDHRYYILHWIISELQTTWELCFCEFTFLTVLTADEEYMPFIWTGEFEKFMHICHFINILISKLSHTSKDLSFSLIILPIEKLGALATVRAFSFSVRYRQYARRAKHHGNVHLPSLSSSHNLKDVYGKTKFARSRVGNAC